MRRSSSGHNIDAGPAPALAPAAIDRQPVSSISLPLSLPLCVSSFTYLLGQLTVVRAFELFCPVDTVLLFSFYCICVDK